MKKRAVLLLLASAMVTSQISPAITENTMGEAKAAGKEISQSVMVKADADGTPNKITISEWEKNGEEKSEEESHTIDADSELPVDVSVTYYLDGKEMEPEDMAGVSGEVTIRFDYQNNETEIVTVDGKEMEVNVPFLAATALMLPSENFSNVKVSDGEVMEDVDDTIVLGTAFPGVAESLKLEDCELTEDVELNDYVEVTADVSDFELEFTATVVTNGVFEELEDEDFDDVDDLVDGINELTDASSLLSEYADELTEGLDEFADAMGEYVEGVDSMFEGFGAFADGIHQFDEDGMQEIGYMADSDLTDLTTRIKALKKADEMYQGMEENPGADVSCKIVIETAEI